VKALVRLSVNENFLVENKKMVIMKNLKSIRIQVIYLNKDLQRITGKKSEVIDMPQGSRSGDFIDFLMERYPKIFKEFGPGYLGFELNGERPHVLTPLKDGDCYKFTTWTEKEIIQDELAKRLEKEGLLMKLPKGEFEIPKWMECTWRRVPCGKDDCPICGGIKRDRQRHIERGEDPDSMESVFEDVGRNLKEALSMIEKDVERFGIDITNINNIKEPPEPESFPLYQKVRKWEKKVSKIGDEAELSGNYWIYTEAAADLFWYSRILVAKTYRQLCNRWHIKNGDDYGEFDHQYTAYVLGKCLEILKRSLKELIGSNYFRKKELNSIYSNLLNLEKQIIKI